MELTAEHILSFIERNYTILDIDDLSASDKLKVIVAKRMNVTTEEIESRTRKTEVMIARHIYHTLCKYVLRMSFANIALKTNKKNHATPLHSVVTIHNLYQTDMAFKRSLNRFLDDMGWEYVKDKLLEKRVTRR